MTPTVPCFFDFSCPWSMCARVRDRKLETALGVRFTYAPWELNPEAPPEGESLDHGAPNEEFRAFAASTGAFVPTATRAFNTRRALRGLAFARAAGREGPYVDAVFHAYWDEQANVYDMEVLRSAAKRAGVDPEGLIAAALDEAWDASLEAVDAWAEALHVKGTVTYALPDGKGGRVAYQGLASEDEVRAEFTRRLPEAGSGASG